MLAWRRYNSEPKKSTPRAIEEAIRTRRRVRRGEAEEVSTRRNPMICPKPPTKTPKCRRKTDDSRRKQVDALLCQEIRTCKLLKMRKLRTGPEWNRRPGTKRDGGVRGKGGGLEGYHICFVRVTGRRGSIKEGTSNRLRMRRSHREIGSAIQTFGLGGGRSRAETTSLKPEELCEPSQKGLFAEWPHRQRPMAVRPAKPKGLPWGSTISKSPSTRMEPLLFTVIFVVGIFSPGGFADGRYWKQQDTRWCVTSANAGAQYRGLGGGCCRGQYFGTLGSTSSDQARMPPLRLRILRKPALRRKSTASADRFPLRQCATISRDESSSCTRRGSSPSGIKCPFKLQIWNSCGSRTSRMKRSSPRSRRAFNSRGVTSGTCTSGAGASSPRTPQNS